VYSVLRFTPVIRPITQNYPHVRFGFLAVHLVDKTFYMKSFSKKLLTLLVAPALLFSFTTHSYKTNFSGSWALNESKSEFGEFGSRFAARKIKADQKDAAITISKTVATQDGSEVTNDETLTFDGKTIESTGLFNSKRKSVMKWADDGQSFVINYTVAFERDGETTEVTGKEAWSLSADGKTLTVQVNSTSSFGEFASKAVYDKQ
jgi:hypothetical protein